MLTGLNRRAGIEVETQGRRTRHTLIAHTLLTIQTLGEGQTNQFGSGRTTRCLDLIQQLDLVHLHVDEASACLIHIDQPLHQGGIRHVRHQILDVQTFGTRRLLLVRLRPFAVRFPFPFAIPIHLILPTDVLHDHLDGHIDRPLADALGGHTDGHEASQVVEGVVDVACLYTMQMSS